MNTTNTKTKTEPRLAAESTQSTPASPSPLPARTQQALHKLFFGPTAADGASATLSDAMKTKRHQFILHALANHEGKTPDQIDAELRSSVASFRKSHASLETPATNVDHQPSSNETHPRQPRDKATPLPRQPQDNSAPTRDNPSSHGVPASAGPAFTPQGASPNEAATPGEKQTPLPISSHTRESSAVSQSSHTSQSSQHSHPPHSAHPPHSPPPTNHQSILDTLTPTQLERVDELLEKYSYRGATRVLSSPPPLGLNLTLSKDTLQRYVKRKEREARRAQSREARDYAASILADPNLNDAQISAAGRHLLRVRILDSILDDNTSLKEAVDLQYKADRLRLIDLAERRLTLAEQKQKSHPSDT